MTQPATATTGTEPTGQIAGWPAYTATADGPSTFWDLAEATAGTSDRWRDLWQANTGRTQPDGSVLDTSAVVLQPGWTVLVPQLPDGGTVDSTGVETDAGRPTPADTTVTSGRETPSPGSPRTTASTTGSASGPKTRAGSKPEATGSPTRI